MKLTRRKFVVTTAGAGIGLAAAARAAKPAGMPVPDANGERYALPLGSTASGRAARYVALAMTTAGRTLVSWAPTKTPTTTSPGFNPDPLIPQRRSGVGTLP